MSSKARSPRTWVTSSSRWRPAPTRRFRTTSRMVSPCAARKCGSSRRSTRRVRSTSSYRATRATPTRRSSGSCSTSAPPQRDRRFGRGGPRLAPPARRGKLADMAEGDEHVNADRHRVVVIGGGFGGLQAVAHLQPAPVDITLIDRRNFHLFQPLTYQVATGALSPGEVAYPLRA